MDKEKVTRLIDLDEILKDKKKEKEIEKDDEDLEEFRCENNNSVFIGKKNKDGILHGDAIIELKKEKLLIQITYNLSKISKVLVFKKPETEKSVSKRVCEIEYYDNGNMRQFFGYDEHGEQNIEQHFDELGQIKE